MGVSNGTLPAQYRQPMWGTADPALRNCLIAAGAIGVAVLVTIFVTPLPVFKPATIEDVPERIARLILEKPRTAPPAAKPEPVAVMPAPKPAPAAEPAPPVAQKAVPRPRAAEPRTAPDRGVQGREKATAEVTRNLASVTRDVDRVLESVARALPASNAAPGSAPADGTSRRRAVRGGRGSGQVASISGVASGPVVDAPGSEIVGKGIEISAITDIAGVDGPAAAGTASASGAGSGGAAAAAGAASYRSNESLMAVVRRHAPGIQYCYDNELKRNPALRGKLVVAITVLASGAVSDVAIVEDSLQSPAVARCMLAQIQGWRFPEIAEGTTSFRAPFVFTPPR